MQTKLNQLKSLLAEVIQLSYVNALLSWDQQVNMPPGGGKDRGIQIALISRLAHEKFTSGEIGQLLSDLKPYASELDPDTDEARLIKVTQRDYDKAIKVPSEYVARRARTVATSRQVWAKAKEASDFPMFRPHLEEVVDLNHEYVAFFAPYDHAYDPLLDRFEPGMKTQEVQTIFTALRPQQVALVQAIAERPQVEDAFLHQPFDDHVHLVAGRALLEDHLARLEVPLYRHPGQRVQYIRAGPC